MICRKKLPIILYAAIVFMVWAGFAASKSASAADEVVSFANPDHMVMYKQLLREYRCLKCQNQNLADSNAGLAGDLRREIREQIVAGKSQTDIESYLVARYGEFVLYRPRFSSKTLVLWIGPFVLFVIGIMSIVHMVRGKANAKRHGVVTNSAGDGSDKRTPDELPTAESLNRARDLLRN